MSMEDGCCTKEGSKKGPVMRFVLTMILWSMGMYMVCIVPMVGMSETFMWAARGLTSALFIAMIYSGWMMFKKDVK